MTRCSREIGGTATVHLHFGLRLASYMYILVNMWRMMINVDQQVSITLRHSSPFLPWYAQIHFLGLLPFITNPRSVH
jgi:hypothetical protein